jgi:hypothetical protein
MSSDMHMTSEPAASQSASPRDWIQITVTALPGVAALIALIFTWLSINGATHTTSNQLRATNNQLKLTEQGQITDRYNAAITNLGSSSVDVRLGGIYALQRIMQDSPRDQPTIVAVLCAFVRDHAATNKIKYGPDKPYADIQAALTVVGTRNTAHESSITVVDFTFAQLTGANLRGMHFDRANFTGADLTDADLTRADLTYAHLGSATLTGAHLGKANFTGVFFLGANFTGAYLVNANLTHTCLVHTNFTGTKRTGVNLAGAICARAKGLTGATCTKARAKGLCR